MFLHDYPLVNCNTRHSLLVLVKTGFHLGNHRFLYWAIIDIVDFNRWSWIGSDTWPQTELPKWTACPIVILTLAPTASDYGAMSGEFGPMFPLHFLRLFPPRLGWPANLLLINRQNSWPISLLPQRFVFARHNIEAIHFAICLS